MKPKRPKSFYTDEPEDQYLMLGSYGGVSVKIPRDKRVKPQIGFVRQPVKVTITKKRK